MRLAASMVVLALVACGCPSKTPTTNGGGSGSAAVPIDNACAAIRPRVEQLYRAEAQANEPKRVDEAVADNTAMVMADCALDPAKVAACVQAAATVADVEKKCLARLDPAGNPIR